MSSKKSPSWEERIHQALIEPVDDPGTSFTRSVMRRIGERPEATRPMARPLLAAAVLVVVAAVLIVTRPGQPPVQPTTADRIHQLAREQQMLTRELEDLRQLRRSAEPVAYLGGDDTVEFVFALNDPRLMNGNGGNSDYRTANR